MKTKKVLLNSFSNINDLLQLPQFIHTLIAAIISTQKFFRQYYAFVSSSAPDFWNINFNQQGYPYMGPVKFSALAIAVNNLLLWPSLHLGVLVGAESKEKLEFARWADQAGYLGAPKLTDFTILDNTLLDILSLLVMYLLAVLIWTVSQKKISLRFSAGYFFYLNAWSLLSTLVSFGFILLAFIIPLHAIGLPQLISFMLGAIYFFMFLGFPLLYWSEVINVERKRIAISLILAIIIWIIILAFTAPLIIPLPQL